MGATFLVMYIAAALAVRFAPLPAALFQASPSSLELTDRHGAPLREVRAGGHFSRETPLAEIPMNLVHAMLAAEDKRFLEHRGVDWLATARALTGNLRRGRVSSGASTITQQLVKLAQPRRRNWRTKVMEALAALRLEQIWTKDQILTAYLNRLDFGNLNVGVAAAVECYFGKPLADLTDAEAAFLAGLPKNPTRLNPYRGLPAASRRQQVVLQRMRADGWLSSDAAARAGAETLRLQPPGRVYRAPHFTDLVLRELPVKTGRVRTTLDAELQQSVEHIVRDRLAPLHAQNVKQAAAVVLDNSTGDILAMVGSESYFAAAAGQVNGALARRSPGSALKPFTYLLAFERGVTPADVAADVPAAFVTPTGVYQPEDFTQRCLGPVRYRLALANSLNIPAVRVLASLGGAAPLRDRLTEWGITTLDRPADQYGLGLTIGNAEVRLLDLANAYASLARLGVYRPYRLSLSPELHSAAPTRFAEPISAGAAWQIADVLSDNEARVHSFGRDSALHFDFPVACKTGTSTDFRDNWAMGYTPEFTVGVWAGNFDGSSMRRVSGVTGAAPILHDIFVQLHGRFGTSWYPRPTELVQREVHPLTGKLLTATRADAVKEWFLPEHLPAMESPRDYDDEGRVILGPEYQQWLAGAQNTLGGQVAVMARVAALRVVAPAPGTTFVVDPDVPSSAHIPLVARGEGALVWRSDTLACTTKDGQTYASATEGRHRLTVRDAGSGQTAETWILVKQL